MRTPPRKTLAANLARMMAGSELNTIKRLHAACPGVSTGNIDRIRRGVVSTGVDTLAELASAFGIEPWELLVPDAADKPLPMPSGASLVFDGHSYFADASGTLHRVPVV